MGKKASPPAQSVSIMLVIPEGMAHQQAMTDFLADQQLATQPIFFNPEEETVKIALVREMLNHSGFARAKSEHQTLGLCAAHTATIPAQNALLKLVEEPPANTQIILGVTSARQLLPTLTSRCREILWITGEVEEQVTNIKLDQLAAFVTNPSEYSLAQLIKLAEELKDRQSAQQTLRSLVHQGSNGSLNIKPKILKNLLAALDSLEKNGNVRLVLEHYLFEIHQLAN